MLLLISVLECGGTRFLMLWMREFSFGELGSKIRDVFSRPMPFALKVQKGIDKGKKSTRF